MGDDNSIVNELKEAFKDLGIPETSLSDNETIPSADSKPESTPVHVKTDVSFDPEKINDIIYLEKQVVEPERLKAIRESISKWANSIPHHDLTNLGEKIELLSAVERPSYLIILQTQYEARKLKKSEYSGASLPNLTVIKSNNDVWSKNVPIVEDFADKEFHYIIEGSDEVFECEDCDGHGEVDCNTCGASGILKCFSCKGACIFKCYKCGGNGEIKCNSCYGKGEKECSGCGGKGYKGIGTSKWKCGSCGGRGYKPCTSCRNGWKNCNECGGKGEIRCRECAGKGEVGCKICKATGEITCSRCKGEGRIVQFLYLDNTFHPNQTVELVHSLEPSIINSIITETEQSAEKGKKDLRGYITKNNTNMVIDIEQPIISSDIFDAIQFSSARQKLSKLLAASKDFKQLGDFGKDYRIIRRKITIYKYDITAVDYIYSGKKYSLFIHGTSAEKICAKTSPIHELIDTYFSTAQNLYENKEYSKALELVEKMLSITPENDKAKELKNQIVVDAYFTPAQNLFKNKKFSQALEAIEEVLKILPDNKEAGELKEKIIGSINADYIKGGTIGGLIAAMTFPLTQNWGDTWWNVLRVPLVLTIGCMTGLIVAWIFIEKASTKIKKSWKRVFYPFIVSVLTIITLVVLWNVTIERFWNKTPETKAPEQKRQTEPVKKSAAVAKVQKQKGKDETNSGSKADEWLKKGISFVKAGNYTDAITAYNKAIQLDPNLAIAYSNRGLAYRQKSQYDMAIEDYNKAIALDPKDVYAYDFRGAAYDDKGQYDMAIEDFNKAISLDPNYTFAYNNRGFAYANKGQYDMAIEDYNKAISLDPNFAIAYHNRGFAYKKLGNEQQMIDDLKIAAKLGSKPTQDFLKSQGIE